MGTTQNKILPWLPGSTERYKGGKAFQLSDGWAASLVSYFVRKVNWSAINLGRLTGSGKWFGSMARSIAGETQVERQLQKKHVDAPMGVGTRCGDLCVTS